MSPGRCRRFSMLATFAATTLIACSSTPAASSGQSGGSRDNVPSKAAQTASSSGQAAGQQIAVRTNTAPANDCDWIPVADVEAIVGKLAGPPKEQDGCRYTLQMPDSVRALR